MNLVFFYQVSSKRGASGAQRICEEWRQKAHNKGFAVIKTDTFFSKVTLNTGRTKIHNMIRLKAERKRRLELTKMMLFILFFFVLLRNKS